MFELNDKVALVTGAARGLGQAIALKLAEAGADLALCDLNAEWVEETAEKVKALGRRAECYGVNVADGESVNAGIKAITKDFGKIDTTQTIHFSFGKPLTIEGNGSEQHQQCKDFIKKETDSWK